MLDIKKSKSEMRERDKKREKKEKDISIYTVMWIRIDCMRIRIQVNEITKLISNHFIKIQEKKLFFKSLSKP